MAQAASLLTRSGYNRSNTTVNSRRLKAACRVINGLKAVETPVELVDWVMKVIKQVSGRVIRFK